MDSSSPDLLSRSSSADEREIDLSHIEAAIAMVRTGAANRVRVVGLAPSEAVLETAALLADREGVCIDIERIGTTERLTLTVTLAG